MDESGNAHFGSNFRALFRHISVCLYLSEPAWKGLSSLEAGGGRESEREGEGEGGREGEMVTSSKVEQTTTVPSIHGARVLLRVGPLPLYPPRR